MIPSDIAGLQFWVKADSLSLNDGDTVGTWPDSSGNGFDATSADDAAKPTFKAGIQNGLPALAFDGVANMMTFSAAVSSQPCTMTIVAKANPKSDRNPFVTSTDSPGHALDVYLSSDNLELFAGTYLIGGGDIAGKFNVITAVFNGTSSQIFVNGELAASGDAGAEFPTSLQVIGKEWTGQFLNGDMAEITMYDSVLSDTDRSALEHSLGTKWGIVINPPYSAHFVYLIPSDRTNVAEQAIHNTALHIQSWLQWQMGNGKTITLTNPVVEVHQTSHPAAFYASNQGQGAITLSPGSLLESGKRYKIVEYHAGDNFTNAGASLNANGVEFVGLGLNAANWTNGSVIQDMFLCWSANVLNDAIALAGAGFGQSHDTWVLYCDAPISDGQIAGGNGGPSGVAYLHAKDVASIMGIDPQWTQCRGIGGHCHELLHTFGRPHPVGDPNWNIAVMGIGYMVYPNAILVQADKDALNTSKFFTVQPTLNAPVGLCPFNVQSGSGYSGYSGNSGYSGYSGQLQAPHLSAPDLINVTSFRIKWAAITGATGYRVDVSLNDNFSTFVYQNHDVGNVLTWTITGLAKHDTYYCRVRAYNPNTTSPNSTVVHSKTRN